MNGAGYAGRRGFDSMTLVEDQSHPLESKKSPKRWKLRCDGLVIDNVKCCAETAECNAASLPARAENSVATIRVALDFFCPCSFQSVWTNNQCPIQKAVQDVLRYGIN